MNNDTEFEKIKKEADEIISEFASETANRIGEVSKFEYNDLNRLLKMIFSNCRDLLDLRKYSDDLKNKITQNELLIDKYLYQKDLSKKDIIDANLYNFIILYNGTYLVTRLLTPNVVEFIKSFIITILIEAFTFDANLKYFTSEKHKQELNDNIEYLNKTIEINKYDVYTFNRFSELYLKELTYEVRKLSEITNYNSEDVNYKRVQRLLYAMEIDFILKEPVKTKIKTKDK